MKRETEFSVSGNIVDIIKKRIFKGTVFVKNGIIDSIKEEKTDSENYILPGFIDSHIHIESSMLIPSEFARIASVHGTVGVVSDPHEIANVMGVKGVEFMIENGKKVSFKFSFGAPSCVPATAFESSGAVIGIEDIGTMMKNPDIGYLAEMMNFPAVVNDAKSVLDKIKKAQENNKPVDGHAPGLSGKELDKYINAGISTDHECFSKEEAVEKIKKGMKILIREGSAAKNFEELIGLIKDYPESIMLCSDDKHPDDLIKGHINLLVKRALNYGYDLFDVLRSVSLNPNKHYNLNNGLLRKGDAADFIISDNIDDFNVIATYIDGYKVAEKGKTLIPKVEEEHINNFKCKPLKEEDIKVKALSNRINLINAIDGQLITKLSQSEIAIENGFVQTDPSNDILKIIVQNRYLDSKPSIAYIKGFGMKKGAIASTVAHDSHNIIAVGTNDRDLCSAINLLIKHRGGIAAVKDNNEFVLPLPVAGLLTSEDAFEVAKKYEKIDSEAKRLGSSLKSPFMTLSFMALLVIPELKISDKGLFDAQKFEFVSLFV